MHPVQMLLGFIAFGGAFGLFVYASNNQHQLRKMKRHHPGVSLFLIMLLGYVVIYFLGSVLVFIFGFALPIAGKKNKCRMSVICVGVVYRKVIFIICKSRSSVSFLII